MIRTLLFAAVFAASMVATATATAKASEVGELAPDAEFTLAKGGAKVKLSSLRGEVVVINYWATWCVPCRTELPTLDNYYRIQKKHGLRVFAATTEDSVPQSMLHRLFDAMAIEPLRYLRGPYGPIKQTVPTNYVIDRQGIVRYAAPGAFDLAALNRILVPLLNEPALPKVVEAGRISNDPAQQTSGSFPSAGLDASAKGRNGKRRVPV